ncbi:MULTISPECIES: hypothetical protein [Metallosphaera]|uniref:hypothetical protein n=1 Tax=Metallosphaera TaxID=41980 RepID=UPI000AA63842|nr:MULTISPECIES: hypothetical protein [Metallosphaera]MCH1770881.1 hypothetical protein [Metallosphaera sedula]MCP6729082.1 hypothetical protein [Metallosphaera sedula]MCY0863270.1 hypothetical protein [Metallosphaera prunae]WPX05830.1 hypothetical protein SOJ17_001851 [Metallosphaera sedula DSM 5348]BBL47995.1 hypothetical protein MJ1HA_2110 [Metallosphaera sedula]
MKIPRGTWSALEISCSSHSYLELLPSNALVVMMSSPFDEQLLTIPAEVLLLSPSYTS